jgi:hypothetical protein
MISVKNDSIIENFLSFALNFSKQDIREKVTVTNL